MKIAIFALSMLSPLALSAQQKYLRLSKVEVERRKAVLLRNLAAFQHRHLTAHHNKVAGERRKLILQQQHHQHGSQRLDRRELRGGDKHEHVGRLSLDIFSLDATTPSGVREYNDTAIGTMFPCPQEEELNRIGLAPSKFDPCVIGGPEPINGSTWVAPCPSDKEFEFFNLTVGDFNACDSNTTMPFDPTWYNNNTNWLFPCPSAEELAFFNLNLTDFEPCDPNVTMPFEPYTPPCPSEEELTYFNTTIALYEPCNHNETMPFDPSWFNGSNWWLPPCPSQEELDLFNLTLTDFEPCDPNVTVAVPISPCPSEKAGPCGANVTSMLPSFKAPSAIWFDGGFNTVDSNNTISFTPFVDDGKTFNDTFAIPCPSEDYNATAAVGDTIPCPPAEFLASIGKTAEEFGCK
jgi:hypothetical protein